MSEIELNINVFEADSGKERIDYLTNNLIDLLREMDIEYLERPQDQNIPSGSKGDPVTVGAIVLGIAAASLPSLIEFVQNWTSERRRVSIEAPSGAKIEFIPEKKYSEDELLALVKKLSEVK